MCWIPWLVNTWRARTSTPPPTNLALSLSSFWCSWVAAFITHWWQQVNCFPWALSASLADYRASEPWVRSQVPTWDAQAVSAVGVVLRDRALSLGGLHWPQRASELSWNVGNQLVSENELLCKNTPGIRSDLETYQNQARRRAQARLIQILGSTGSWCSHLALASRLWKDFGSPALLWAASQRCRLPPHSHSLSLMAFSGLTGSLQVGCLLSPSGATGPPRLIHRNTEIH